MDKFHSLQEEDDTRHHSNSHSSKLNGTAHHIEILEYLVCGDKVILMVAVSAIRN